VRRAATTDALVQIGVQISLIAGSWAGDAGPFKMTVIEPQPCA
jgi:hypothetical protein